MSTYLLTDDPLPGMMCGYYEKKGPGGHAWVCLADDHRDNPELHYLVPVARSS